eukprot:2218749-Ditylum_brightwellii.AAC.1
MHYKRRHMQGKHHAVKCKKIATTMGFVTMTGFVCPLENLDRIAVWWHCSILAFCIAFKYHGVI